MGNRTSKRRVLSETALQGSPPSIKYLRNQDAGNGNGVQSFSDFVGENGEMMTPYGVSSVLSLSSLSPADMSSDQICKMSLQGTELKYLRKDVSQFIDGAISGSPNAIVCCDSVGVIHVFNMAAEDLFGYTKAEVLGKKINMLMPDHFAQTHDFFMSSYKQMNTREFLGHTCSIQCKKKDGKEIPVEITVMEISSDSSDMRANAISHRNDQSVESQSRPHFLCHIRSVQADVQIRLLMKLHTAINDTSTIPIIGIETDCRITVFNKTACETFGYTLEEALGSNVNMLIQEKYRQFHDSFVETYLRTSIKRLIGRRRLDVGVHKNGELIPVELNISEVFTESQRYFIGFVRDQRSIITQDEENNRAQIADRIYPPAIAARVVQGDKICDHHPSVTIIFADIVGFTALSSTLSSTRTVELLDSIFTLFDENVASKYGLEKIKTMGDCYMAACGIPSDIPDHAVNCVRGALDMMKLMDRVNIDNPDLRQNITLRIGIHSGEATAGIVGSTKPAYDVWGDAVNTASRMESHGVPGEIHISSDTYTLLSSNFKDMFVKRDPIPVKGKGIMSTYATQFNNKIK